MNGNLNLSELEKELDEMLSKETSETLSNWLLTKRKTNNMEEILKLSCSSDLHYKIAMAIKLKEKLYKERIKQLKEQLLYTKVAYDAVLECGEEGIKTVKKLKLLDKYKDIVSDKWIDIDNFKQNESLDIEFKKEFLQVIIN